MRNIIASAVMVFSVAFAPASLAIDAEDVERRAEDARKYRDMMESMDRDAELIQRRIQHAQIIKQADMLEFGGLPYIVAIMRMNGTWVVRLQTDDGVVQNYLEGDLVLKGTRISSITSKGVTVMQGKKSVALKTLPASSTGGSGMTPGGMSNIISLPAFPPMPMPQQ